MADSTIAIMTVPDYDVAILGAGPAGSALALALAQTAPQPARIALLRKTPAPSSPISHVDPRTIALNHGSLALLAALAATPTYSALIHTIHVSQRGGLGRTLIRHDDFGVPALGRVARYDTIQAALEQALQHSDVTVLTGSKAAVTEQNRDGVTLAHNHRRLRAAVTVSADGVPQGTTHTIRRDYNQHAVLATVAVTRPRPGWAWERFTRAGPLALLPHPDGNGLHALVWCCTPAQAATLQALSETAFAAALLDAFGTRLGNFRVVGPRTIAPLALALRTEPVCGRCVAIGNAAQTLHPVAGQGLNLGLRDAARLAQALAPWLARSSTSPHADPTPQLAEFARARRADRCLTTGITDMLPRIFTTALAPVEHLSGLALTALDMCVGLRTPLARHLLLGLRT